MKTSRKFFGERYTQLGVLMLGVSILLNCKDAGVEGPFGDFLFLEQYVVEEARVLEGDSIHIPIAVCEDGFGTSYSYDVNSKELSIYYFNRTFDIQNMAALFGNTVVPSWFVACGFRDPNPLYNLPDTVGSFGVQSISTSGDVVIAVVEQSYTISANDSLVFLPSADTIRGVYTVPPDTTLLPYAIELIRAGTIRNFGFWPKRNITFVVD
jgi:hypothetical protein